MENKYKAMGFADPGNKGMLTELTLLRTEPAPDQVCIRVHRAGVAFGDIIRGSDQIIRIKSYPFIPGYDIAGTVISAGSKVQDLKPGDRVLAYCETGGYAQFINIRADMAVKIPDSVAFEQAVALTLNYVTAWQMMFDTARVSKGDTILIHSAAGGVGSAVLDLARYAGLKTYGTASASKHDFVRSFGALPIDYKSENYTEALKRHEPEGVDAAFDALGFSSAAVTRESVKRKGKLVMFGYLENNRRGKLDIDKKAFLVGLFNLFVRTKGRKTALYGINALKKTAYYRETEKKLLALAAEKKIVPAIYDVLPLSKANEAQLMLSQSRVAGKVVLNCE